MPQIKFIFAWFDLWIGLYIDRTLRRVYFFPIPCFGFVIDFGAEIPEPLKTTAVVMDTMFQALHETKRAYATHQAYDKNPMHSVNKALDYYEEWKNAEDPH